jgi:SAM-dependent methyltransferase
MSLRFFEIAESNHRIQNPFTEEKLMLLGDLCRLSPGMRQLDLACGKGEMLCRWAQTYGISGVGVDLSPVFLSAAQARAAELGVSERLTFEQGDAGAYAAEPGTFDIVSCIGATWIGDGFIGTLRKMRPALAPNGLALVGEPYWLEPPPYEVYEALGVARDDFTTLSGQLARIEAGGFELLDMVMADPDSWDRYQGLQWRTVSDFLRDHPDDPDAPMLRRWINEDKQNYLKYGRRYMGWGVFVLRRTSAG